MSDSPGRSLPRAIFPAIFLVLVLLLCSLTADAFRPAWAALARKDAFSPALACNPQPLADDIILPMPYGLSMAFRLVAVPARGLLWDMPLRPGLDDSAQPDRAFYDRRYSAALSAPFTLTDLPGNWRAHAPRGQYFFYLAAKYEISRLQWRAVMEEDCPPPASLTAEAALPVTDISWYDAVEFTHRYSTWLLQNAPEALPRFAGDSRHVGFVRLPTETEWEYAARGGQHTGSQQLLQEDFFVLPPAASKADYAVYRSESGGPRPEGPARIGSRKPNPLGLHDTAGNAAEMVLDSFRFSVGGRLHGSAGGFVRKGGSFVSGDSEILPGRREESPFFLVDGPARARDLGFRPIISGINTPGGPRPQQLLTEWQQAGERPAHTAAARDPLQELDRLLALAPDDASKKNLHHLRAIIKENNIILEQQKELEAQSLLRTGVYMIETIRNYASRRLSLQSQIESMQRDRATVRGKALEKLAQILDTAQRGLARLDTSLENSLTFYRSKVEDGAGLDIQALAAARQTLERDFGGTDPFNRDMRQNLGIFLRHMELQRAGKGLARAPMRQEILERRFQ